MLSRFILSVLNKTYIAITMQLITKPKIKQIT